MFSKACVILFTGGSWCPARGVSGQRGCQVRGGWVSDRSGGGCLVKGGCVSGQRMGGVWFLRGRSPIFEGISHFGEHAIGMHTCSHFFFKNKERN